MTASAKQKLAYPEYQNTGVEWLGEIPIHWDIRPLFALANENKQRNVDNQETNVLSLSYGRIIQRDVSSNFGLLPESFETYQKVGPGDIVLRLTDLQNDQRSLRVGLVKEKGIITSAYIGLKLKQIDQRFCYYLLHSYDLAKVFYALGGGVRQSMNFSDLKHLPLLLPSIVEQQAIADFLDSKTSKIDTLIAELNDLLKLVSEKRQAIISHAVTRGINPDVTLIDSGVDWIGEIPEHWRIVQIKRLCRLGNGSTPLRENNAYWDGGEYPWLTSTVVNEDIIGEPEQFVTELALQECHLPKVRPNSVLVAITGQGKTRGMSGILRYEATINQHLAFISPKLDQLDSRFLQLYLTGSYEVLRMISEGTGSTRGALTVEQLGEFPVVLPSLDEQNKIVNQVDQATLQLDELTAQVKNSIELLQERRSALIAAAVMGKIRVTE